MPRFVVLFHRLPAGSLGAESLRSDHYDLMLEHQGVLWTWACDRLPDVSASGEQAVAAERLPDHRLAYLDYEGPVSGERGTVTRVASGCYALLAADERRIAVTLAGDSIAGELVLTKDGDQWSLTLTTTPKQEKQVS
jgi:hypothetical protein